MDWGPEHETKEFKKKNPKLETLSSYKGKFKESYWKNWTKKVPTPDQVPSSWIDADKLEKVAKELNYTSQDLEKTLHWCRNGVDIGCKEPRARLPTPSKNSPTAYEYGVRVSDSLQSAILEGTILGPMTMDELTQHGILDPKILPLAVRLKPNAKARLIINASYPHFTKYELEKLPEVISVNDGIDIR